MEHLQIIITSNELGKLEQLYRMARNAQEHSVEYKNKTIPLTYLKYIVDVLFFLTHPIKYNQNASTQQNTS